MRRLARRNHALERNRSGVYSYLGPRRRPGRAVPLVPTAPLSVGLVQIRCGVDRYPVLIGAGLLNEFRTYAHKYLPGETCVVISDRNVARLFANRVTKSLTSAGLTLGANALRAAYSGDSNFGGSISATVVVYRSPRPH